MCDRSNVPHMPSELVHNILEHISDERDIGSASLSCRRFRAVALPILYRSVVLDFTVDQTVRTQNMLRHLHLNGDEIARVISHISIKWAYPNHPIDDQLVVRLLSSINALKSLTWNASTLVPLAVMHSFHDLQPQAQLILILDIVRAHSVPLQSYCETSEIQRLLSSSPSISQFCFKNKPLYHYSTLPCIPRLTHLRLTNLNAIDHVPTARGSQSAVLKGDWSALRHLTLESTLGRRSLSNFLTSFSGRTPLLREFFCGAGNWNIATLQTFLKQTPSIKTLGVRGVDISSVITVNVRLSSDLTSLCTFDRRSLYALIPTTVPTPSHAAMQRSYMPLGDKDYWAQQALNLGAASTNCPQPDTYRLREEAWFGSRPRSIKHLAFRDHTKHVDAQAAATLFTKLRGACGEQLECVELRCIPDQSKGWYEDEMRVWRAQDKLLGWDKGFEEIGVVDGVKVGRKDWVGDWRGELQSDTRV